MPADFVNKLARMFQDIKVSEDLCQDFKEAHRNNNEGIAGITFVLVHFVCTCALCLCLCSDFICLLASQSIRHLP